MDRKTLSLVLSIAGVGGVGLTSYLAVRGCRKADKETDKKKKVLAYAPAIVSGVATSACIIGAHGVACKEIAMLTASCGYLAANRDKILKNVEDKLGKEETKELQKKSIPKYTGQTIEETGYGDDIFIDCYSGRIFRSSIEAVCEAQDQLNKRIEEGKPTDYNDYFMLLGIETTDFGDLWGWPTSKYGFDEPVKRIEFENDYVAPACEKYDWMIHIYTFPVETY